MQREIICLKLELSKYNLAISKQEWLESNLKFGLTIYSKEVDLIFLIKQKLIFSLLSVFETTNLEQIPQPND